VKVPAALLKELISNIIDEEIRKEASKKKTERFKNKK
tara:strand:+ start:905 stop:1015 length:111 start_codon:yes stop_codon:yes gene_type:complete